MFVNDDDDDDDDDNNNNNNNNNIRNIANADYVNDLTRETTFCRRHQ